MYEEKKFLSNIFSLIIILLIIVMPLSCFTSVMRGVNIWIISIEVFTIMLLVTYNISLIELSNQKKLYIFIFIFRIILLVYQSIYGNLPMSGADSGVFHNHAMMLIKNADNFIELIIPSKQLENRGDFFERIVALVYYLFGNKTQYIYYISYIASEIVFLFIYKVAFLIKNEKEVAIGTALLFYIWPMEVIYSVSYLREMTMQAFFAVSIYCFIKYIKQSQIRFLLVSLLMAYVCAGIHSGMIAIFVSYISIITLYNKYSKKIIISPIRVLIILLIFVVLTRTAMWDSVTGRFSNIHGLEDIIINTGDVVGATDYISTPSTDNGVIMQTPLRLFLFYFSPLPWHITNVSTVIAFVLDGALRLYLGYSIFKNYRYRNCFDDENKAIFIILLIIVLLTDLIFSWGTNNFGTAMRHRLKIFPIEVILLYTFRFTKKKEHVK